VISTLRAQVIANCPTPASSCAWARTDLLAKVRETVTGPSFAAAMDVLDAVRKDAPARTEIERLLVYLLGSEQEDAATTTLTAITDLLQVFADDKNVTALLNAAADAAGPEVLNADGRVAERGLVLAAIEVLARVLGEAHDRDGRRLCSREIDPNGTLPIVLKKLLTPSADLGPVPGAKGNDLPPRSPLDVLLDVIADVNRQDPTESSKLTPDDYRKLAYEVEDFCANKERGLEQVYEVIKQATKDL
jgi:hypothetical protein